MTDNLIAAKYYFVLVLLRVVFLVAAAFRIVFFVVATLRAAVERCPAERFLAADLAWRESAAWEAAVLGSRLSAFSLASDRFPDTGSCACPFL